MARKKRLSGNTRVWSDDWEEFLRQIRSQTAVDFSMNDVEKARKLRELEANPIEWMKFMFYKYAKYEFARFQKKAINRIIGHSDGNWYEVLSWARELAKSTIVMMIVLYLVLVKKNKRVIILVSATNDAAIKLLNVYRAQFEANERLKYFYDNLIGDKWTEDYFTLSSRASFMAMGWGQSPRGVKLDEVRPDLLLMDDYDTDEECRNPDIVNNKWNWFEQALFFTRSISEALMTIWTGNVIAKDCCVVRAGNKARELAAREKPIGNWDIAAWHFCNVCNAGIDIEMREKRYDRAIEWLKNNQNRKNPDLPAAPDNTDGHCPRCSADIAFGSNRKRDNHF